MRLNATPIAKFVLSWSMSFRRVLTLAAFILLAIVIAGQLRQFLDDPKIWPPDDFVEYWAAAKITLAGGNPYDPDLLLPLERFAGRATNFDCDDVEPTLVGGDRPTSWVAAGTGSAAFVAGNQSGGNWLLRRPVMATLRWSTRKTLCRMDDRTDGLTDGFCPAIGPN